MRFVPAPFCNTAEPLLSGNNPVPDAHFTASSEYGSAWAPHTARINATVYAWCPSQAEIDAVPPNFYIQVNQSCSDSFCVSAPIAEAMAYTININSVQHHMFSQALTSIIKILKLSQSIVV